MAGGKVTPRRRAVNQRIQKMTRIKKLDKLFDCVSCAHEKTVRCSLDHVKNIGSLSCELCDVHYTTRIHHLNHDVDVYHDWIDACDEINQKEARTKSQSHRQGSDRDRRLDTIKTPSPSLLSSSSRKSRERQSREMVASEVQDADGHEEDEGDGAKQVHLGTMISSRKRQRSDHARHQHRDSDAVLLEDEDLFMHGYRPVQWNEGGKISMRTRAPAKVSSVLVASAPSSPSHNRSFASTYMMRSPPTLATTASPPRSPQSTTLRQDQASNTSHPSGSSAHHSHWDTQRHSYQQSRSPPPLQARKRRRFVTE